MNPVFPHFPELYFKQFLYPLLPVRSPFLIDGVVINIIYRYKNDFYPDIQNSVFNIEIHSSKPLSHAIFVQVCAFYRYLPTMPMDLVIKSLEHLQLIYLLCYNTFNIEKGEVQFQVDAVAYCG